MATLQNSLPTSVASCGLRLVFHLKWKTPTYSQEGGVSSGPNEVKAIYRWNPRRCNKGPSQGLRVLCPQAQLMEG